VDTPLLKLNEIFLAIGFVGFYLKIFDIDRHNLGTVLCLKNQYFHKQNFTGQHCCPVKILKKWINIP
jgi:hypothetical protein